MKSGKNMAGAGRYKNLVTAIKGLTLVTLVMLKYGRTFGLRLFMSASGKL